MKRRSREGIAGRGRKGGGRQSEEKEIKGGN